jgi:hypothetical protein
MPASPSSRRRFIGEVMARAAEFALARGAPSYLEALAAPLSAVDDFFQSEPFRKHLELREAELKLQAGVCERLNNVIRGLGVLARAGRFR